MDEEAKKTALKLQNFGYIETPNILPTHEFFCQLYSAFDDFIALLLKNSELEILINNIAEDWRKLADHESFYAGAPPKFQDRTRRDDKAEKIYLQFCLEYFLFFSRYKSIYQQYPEVKKLYDLLLRAHYAALQVFRPFVELLSVTNPGLEKVLLPKTCVPPVMLKLVRYEPSGNLGTAPHHDKSALTLLMNSDDQGNEKFAVGRCEDGWLKLSDLKPPLRQKPNERGAILFPGMCLREAGFERLQPSPHCVLPVLGRKRRHSLIAFLLVPHLKTDALVTNVEFRGPQFPLSWEEY